MACSSSTPIPGTADEGGRDDRDSRGVPAVGSKSISEAKATLQTGIESTIQRMLELMVETKAGGVGGDSAALARQLKEGLLPKKEATPTDVAASDAEARFQADVSAAVAAAAANAPASRRPGASATLPLNALGASSPSSSSTPFFAGLAPLGALPLGRLPRASAEATAVEAPKTASSMTPLQLLAEAASREEISRANAAKAARPAFGYARASMMNRAADVGRGQTSASEAAPSVDLDTLMAASAAAAAGAVAADFVAEDAARGADSSSAAVAAPETDGKAAADSKSADLALQQATGFTALVVEDETALTVYIGNLPLGTADGLIKAECVKYGQIASMTRKKEPWDPLIGGWVRVKYMTSAMATTAVQKMSRKSSLFGSSEKLEVRNATAEELEPMQASPLPESVPPDKIEEQRQPEKSEVGDSSRSKDQSATSEVGNRAKPDASTDVRERSRSRRNAAGGGKSGSKGGNGRGDGISQRGRSWRRDSRTCSRSVHRRGRQNSLLNLEEKYESRSPEPVQASRRTRQRVRDDPYFDGVRHDDYPRRDGSYRSNRAADWDDRRNEPRRDCERSEGHRSNGHASRHDGQRRGGRHERVEGGRGDQPRRELDVGNEIRSLSEESSESSSPPAKPEPAKRVSRVLGGFDRKDDGGLAVKKFELTGGKQVCTRGEWAKMEIATDQFYYLNLKTGETRVDMPPGFVTPQFANDPRTALGKNKLYVSRLPVMWDEAMLGHVFKPFGTITNVTIHRDPSGQPLGSGFVVYSTDAEAQSAINNMHGFFINGHWLKVSMSRF